MGQIEDYILKYNGSYSRDEIKRQLKNSGFSKEDIDSAYQKINADSNSHNISSTESPTKSGYSGLALGLSIFGFIIPLISIVGLILGFRARNINKSDGMALAAIILGFISLFIYIFILLISVVGFQMWFNSYQSDIVGKIESQPNVGVSSVKVDRVENNGDIYITNVGSISIDGFSLEYGGNECGLSSDILFPGVNELTYDNKICNFSSLASAEVLLKTPDSIQPYTVIIS